MKKEHPFVKLFKPHSIALVGASNKDGKVGNMLAKNLTKFSYLGEVFFVNHNAQDICGRNVYSSVADIGREIDIVIIAIPAQFVHDTIKAAADYCSRFVVISAGFGEAGIEGLNRETQLHTLAQKKGLTILGPNCLGFLSPEFGLNASFAPGLPVNGDTAFISQSGALAVALVDRAQALGIGFSHVVSVGNKMQMTEVELITYFADDPETKTIILYLESIVGGVDFLKAVYYARTHGKRVVILKSGKTAEAQEAIALHTGSLTSGDIVTEAVFHKMGIIRAHTVHDIFTLAALSHPLATQKGTASLAVITNAGGPGVIATDAIAEVANIKRADLSKETVEELTAYLPATASTHNPIDLLGDALADRYAKAVDACVRDNNVDMILVLLTPQEQTPSEKVAHFLVEAQQHTEKLIIASFIGGVSVTGAHDILRQGGVLHVDTPTDAIHALDQLVATDCKMPAKILQLRRTTKRVSKTAKVLDKIYAQNKRGLYFEESRIIADAYNIPISTAWDVTNGLGTKTPVTYPCVAKVDDPHILHKSDRGGVILPITTATELTKSIATLRKKFPEKTARIIAQPLVGHTMELIIGMKRDPFFGPVIVVGMGGIYTEIFHKTEVFVAPCTKEEVVDRLRNGVLAFLFAGARGQSPYDVKEIVDVVIALQSIAHEHERVQAIDINPLLVYNDGTKANAVDVKIIF